MFKSILSFFNLVLLLFISFSLQAQDREHYSLLWEIENPNTHQTSYVFGTMHLSDARVFEFSDALFPAIQSVESFALEVHPDSVMNGMKDTFLKKVDLNRYKKVLGKDDYNRLSDKIERISGKPLDSLEFNSLDYLESLLRPDVSKEDDEEVFLDIFLYTVAVSNEKKIKGLENVNDQFIDIDNISDEELKEALLYFLEDSEDIYRRELDSMIEIYYDGNIDKIYEKVREYEAEEDLRLDSRNEVMAISIEKITNQQTLFAAIGAAHLPGEKGVLQLLKDKGFKVRKSIATFNKPNLDLIAQSNLDTWQLYSNQEKGYELLMPKDLGPTNKNTIYGITGYGTDMINVLVGAHFTIDIPESKRDSIDVLLEKMIDKFVVSKEGYNVESVETKSKNGNEYKKINFSKGNKLNTTEIHIVNDKLYLFSADFKNTANSLKAAQYFFDNIKFFTPEKKVYGWSTLQPENAAFSVDFPTDFRAFDKELPNPFDETGDPYVMHLFQATNKEKKEQYLIRYNDFPLGYYLEDISETVKDYIRILESKNIEVINSTPTSYKGHIAYDLEIKMLKVINGKVRLLFRGNRLYLLMYQSLEPNVIVSSDNRFFNSFEFLEYQPTTFEEISITNNYRFKFPDVNAVSVDSTFYNPADILFTKDFQGYDYKSGNVYLAAQSRLGKYFFIDHNDEYFEQYEEELFPDGIEYEKKPFYINGISGYEYVSKVPNSDLLQRYRMFSEGQNIFLFGTYQEAASIYSESTEEFFNSFQILEKEKFDPIKSKTDLLLKNLTSQDSLIFTEAFNAIDYYSFEKKDGDEILKHIKKSYPNDSLYLGAKNMLIYSLALLKEPQYLNDLETLYTSTASENIKGMIIQALPLFDSTDAIDLQMNLLKREIPQLSEYSLTFLESENDSLIDLKKYGNQIWDLQKNSGLRDLTLNYFNRKITTDENALPFLRERKQELATLFQKDASAVASGLKEDTKHLSPYELSSYFKLLDTLQVKDQQTMKYIKELVAVEEDRAYVHLNALEHYLKYEPKVDKKLVRRFIEDLYYRFEGMELIAKTGHSKLIPDSYYKDKEFARLSVYNSLYDYDENMVIKYLGELEENNVTYIVYQFNYTNYEDETNYVAIARKHKIDKNNPEQFEVWLSGEGFVNNDWQSIALPLINDWQSEENNE